MDEDAYKGLLAGKPQVRPKVSKAPKPIKPISGSWYVPHKPEATAIKSPAVIPLPQDHIEWVDALERTRVHRFGAKAEPPLTFLERATLDAGRPGERTVETLAGRVPYIEDIKLLTDKDLQAAYDQAKVRGYRVAAQDRAAAQWLESNDAVTVLPDGRRVVEGPKLGRLLGFTWKLEAHAAVHQIMTADHGRLVSVGNHSAMPAKKRGRKGNLTARIAEQIHDDLTSGRRTLQWFEDTKDDTIKSEYGARSRSTLKTALKRATERMNAEFPENSDK